MYMQFPVMSMRNECLDLDLVFLLCNVLFQGEYFFLQFVALSNDFHNFWSHQKSDVVQIRVQNIVDD